MIGSAVLALLALAPGHENRLWFLELELRGACESVRLDCGPEGETLLLGPFLSGEDRRLTVPVPVRSPLGREGLASIPLPRAEVRPPAAGAEARILGWSKPQPCEGLEAVGAQAWVRPPATAPRARAHAPELLIALAAGGFLVHLRRRPWVVLILAAASGGLVYALAHRRSAEPVMGDLLQWHDGSEAALRIRGAQGSLPLTGAALEVGPEGLPIRIEWEARGSGRAVVRQASLYTLALAVPPVLTPQHNGAELLAETWTRTAGGAWRAHGRWSPGAALGPGREGVPPGWISASLPPGIGVLLARSSTGGWLRCLGFAGH